ncbi:hypothetical protein ACQZ2F_21660 [Pseudomonas lurida]|jgi:hypothetical protein|uniref:hypothetical protein n=1 Tax=Pseudomonas lurida TaxID=244566 RepID=UPI003D29AA5D
MNSTSIESRHAQYNLSTLSALAQESGGPGALQPQGLNLTSSPKSSFKAPTAEDFDKGSRLFIEEPPPTPLLAVFASLWTKLSRR